MHTGVEGAALQSLLPTTKGGDEEDDQESTSVCDGGGTKPNQTGNTFGDKQETQPEENGQESSQQRTSSR